MLKLFLLVIHPTDFNRLSDTPPIATDGRHQYIRALNFAHAELLVADMVDGNLDDGREYDVFEMPKTAVWCGIDITPKPNALIFDAIDTPTEPGKYFYKAVNEEAVNKFDVRLGPWGLCAISVLDENDVQLVKEMFWGQWYKKRGKNE